METENEQIQEDNENFSQNSFQDIEEKKKYIYDNYHRILKICEELTEQKEKLIEDMKDIASSIKEELANQKEKTINDIEDSHNCITDTYNKVIEYEEELFGNGETQGKKDKVDTLIQDYKTLIDKDKKNIENRESSITAKTDELFDRIEGLLPGATAAGLAEAYKQAKEETQRRIWIWSAAFLLALILFAIEGWILIIYKAVSFEPDISLSLSILQLLRAACFELPFIWLAWAANIKVSQYTRLNEEYLHKWTMMRVFDGMRKALNESENANEENNIGYFYRMLLDSFANNPSKTLDKQYSPDGPFSFLETLKNYLKKDDATIIKADNESQE